MFGSKRYLDSSFVEAILEIMGNLVFKDVIGITKAATWTRVLKK